MLRNIIFSAFLSPAILLGIDYRPWYPNLGEVQGRATYLFQTFRKVECPHGNKKYHSNDSFLNASCGASLLSYFAELGVTAADTRHRSLGLDCLSLEGRYQIWDDVTAAEPVSLIAGLVLTKATKPALHDLGSFHHGRFEGEVHLSVGKEYPCEEFWVSRWWAVLGVGLGDTGSPWIRFNANWENNFWNLHQWGLFVNTLWGMGNNHISRYADFHGYGPIAHRSVDLGGSYSYLFDFGCLEGTVSAAYAYRVYAKNFPKNASLITLSVLVPFGTGI